MLMGSGGKDVPIKLLVNSTPNEIVPQHLRTRPSNTDSSGFISLTGNCKESAISLKQSIAYSEIADFLGSGSAGIHEGEQYSISLSIITSVAKDRKAPSGGKSRTREADDAAIFA